MSTERLKEVAKELFLGDKGYPETGLDSAVVDTVTNALVGHKGHPLGGLLGVLPVSRCGGSI